MKQCNIVIAINDSYVHPAIIMLTSLAINNNEDLFVIHVFHGKALSAESILRIKNKLKKYKNLLIKDVVIPESIFVNYPLKKYWSREIYYRLLIPYYVNDDRALWLDSGIIVNKSIPHFYRQSFMDNCVIACKGCNQTPVKRLNLPENHIYFNSGVILFNIEKIRTKYSSYVDILELIVKYQDILEMPDQDILNIMFSGNALYADSAIYNHETFGFSVIRRDEIKVLREESVIIHYNGPIKPWDYKGVNWADTIWWHYERKQGNYIAFFIYRIRNSPIKFISMIRELLYIVSYQIKKRRKL